MHKGVCYRSPSMESLPSLTDDGLVTPVVGDWAEEKYRLAKCYASIFAISMKNKWECLVYVDLYAGAGRSRLGHAGGRIVPATPLLVLDAPQPFTRYIFCELESPKLDALRRRIVAGYPERDVQFVEGDCNAKVDEIANLIPSYRKTNRVLTFCFVDPYNIGTLSFATLERLSRDRKIDFLVLIASGMDANRNQALYLRPENRAITSFLGSDAWREEWKNARLAFGDFVADQFGTSMRRLGYVYDDFASLHPMYSTEKHLSLYHLGVFSKHPLGAEFWEKCKQSASPQRSFPFV
jgi:three-Cys-motif partner protein